MPKKSLNTSFINQIDSSFENAWNTFITDNPKGSVLQSAFAFRLFESTNHFTPVLICCYDDQNICGILLGVLIREAGILKTYFSSRLVVYGGPVIADKHPERNKIFSLMLEELIIQTQKKSIFIQFRASYDLSSFSEIFYKHRFTWAARLNLLVDASDADAVRKDISSSKKRQIKKSLMNGAKVLDEFSKSQLLEFYSILRELYKNKVKKPLPDFSFFESFWNLSKNGMNSKIFLILFQEKVIGGILAPYYPGKAIFEWYVCGLDIEYRKRGIYPSVLATWTVIEFATRNNLQQFDFMGVGKPEEPYGVRDFKMKFGGNVVNYGRYIRINNKFFYSLAEFAYNLLSFFKKV